MSSILSAPSSSSADEGASPSSAHQQPSTTIFQADSTDNTALLLSSLSEKWAGFVIVGDNIDRTLRPRHQTLESRTLSLHYFNSYAVLDRCNFISIPECKPSQEKLTDVDVEQLLPSEADLKQLLYNLSILTGRILAEHVPGFAQYKHLTKDHIRHKYYREMCKKSQVVSWQIIMYECTCT